MKRNSAMSLIFLAFLLTAHLAVVSANCDACFDGACYRKIIVLERFKQTGQLAIDRHDNIFYFHVKDNLKKSFTLAFDLTNVQLHQINDLDSSFARAVDQSTRDIYISDYAAVYKTNPKDNFDYDTELVFNNATVWHMQFKDKLYYTLFNTKGLKYYERGIHKEVNALSNYEIDDFVIDFKDNIYFVSEYNLYQLKHGENVPKMISDEFFTLTTDKYGSPHFIQPFARSLYKINESDKLFEIGAFASGVPYKAVFTSDNTIIYSDTEYDGIYLLVPKTGNCKISSTGSGKNVKKTVTVSD